VTVSQRVLASNQEVAFRIVGNVLIESTGMEMAKVKLMKHYPGCTILSVQVKRDCRCNRVTLVRRQFVLLQIRFS
jgi:hypothetical protein